MTGQCESKLPDAATAVDTTFLNRRLGVQQSWWVDDMLAAEAYGQQRRALLAGEAALPEVAQ